ncbi:isoprenyl transferase [Rhodocaloribacter litoris]|uniref:isoprenyl transferase n=1 Tax=Rhodocaloribacter litoris TaxID=2558931 RepID=UPI001E42FA1F|nr:isoprenyl transferase [Rhodocaloribacter litoris]
MREDPVISPAEAGTAKASDKAVQAALRRRGPLPRHIAVIMDGNGRWARARGQLRYVGHYEGVESVRDVTEACAELGIEYLTLYTFSTENWHRPRNEVNALMQLLIRTLRREKETLHRNNIRLRALGDLSKLPEACRKELEEAMAETAGGTRMTLTLALSYSGRWELTEAMRGLARRVAAGELDPGAIDEATVGAALGTAGMPDPDLLIRTGGELRVSNFLLWQIAYAEFYVTDVLWPAFRRAQLYEAIRDFQDRDRRFGRVHDDEGPAAAQ